MMVNFMQIDKKNSLVIRFCCIICQVYAGMLMCQLGEQNNWKINYSDKS